MKKLFAVLMAAVLLVCMLAGCGDSGENPQGGNSGNDDPTVVNLMDMYSVKDPEGVEYDKRIAYYMPVLEGSEDYARGLRNLFTVLYGKDGKGVFMYDVQIFDSEASAKAFQTEQGEGTVDGTAFIMETDAAFFAAMEAFMPDLQGWIDSFGQAGYIDLD